MQNALRILFCHRVALHTTHHLQQKVLQSLIAFLEHRLPLDRTAQCSYTALCGMHMQTTYVIQITTGGSARATIPYHVMHLIYYGQQNKQQFIAETFCLAARQLPLSQAEPGGKQCIFADPYTCKLMCSCAGMRCVSGKRFFCNLPRNPR